MAARRGKLLGALLLAMGGLAALPLPGHADEVGEKGAEIYCFMRQAGNPHGVSWDSAYARIKRQNNGLFKTSPEHAAVLITETVVNQKDKFGSCARFLGALYSGREETGADHTPNLGIGNSSSSGSTGGGGSAKPADSGRYSY